MTVQWGSTVEQGQKYAFWRDEYLKLQDQYEDFDRRSLTIKGWVAGGSIVAIGIGLDPQKPNPMIWLAIGVVSLCFWYLEAHWKMFQYAYRARIRVLEAAFRSDPEILCKDPVPFQIYDWWFKAYGDDVPIYPGEQRRSYGQRLLAAAFQSFVMLPYVPLILASIVGFVWRLYPA